LFSLFDLQCPDVLRILVALVSSDLPDLFKDVCGTQDELANDPKLNGLGID
jgi:hypothetical protein